MWCDTTGCCKFIRNSRFMSKRLALVVGINSYTVLLPLKCAVADAKEFAEVLRGLDFEVICSLDEDGSEVNQKFDLFEERLFDKPYDVALFYFAGHGCMANRSDCLMLKESPELTIDTEVKVKNKSLVLDSLCTRLRGAGDQINIFILDACRSEAGRSATYLNFNFGKNLHIPYQTFIAYSTSPGATAKDGTVHSPYTQSLLSNIRKKNLSIESLFKQVRKEIYQSVGQLSWDHSCLIEDFYFCDKEANLISVLYSPDALADKQYVSKIEDVNKIISLFRTYNYYHQIDAVDLFKRNFKKIAVDDLFVIGRNILQAAVGGSWECTKLMDYSFLRLFQQGDRNPVLDGVLYEIYFNSSAEFRLKGIKIGNKEIFDKIASLSIQKDFEGSFLFIQSVLEKYKKHLKYLPGQSKLHTIRVNLHIVVVDDLFDDKIWEVDEIILDNKNEMALFSDNCRFTSLPDFLDFLSLKFGIPLRFMKINYSHDVKQNDHFRFVNEIVWDELI